jgi:hypothetical protein
MNKKLAKIVPSEVITVAGSYRSDERDEKLGDCQICQASGWLHYGYGYPYGAKDVSQNFLVHKKSCRMNSLLKENGQLK